MNGTRSQKPVKVQVAAFGKHPGWDDHIEEIGLDSDALVRAKRVLYTECIRANVDSGDWEKLDESKRLPFRHEFLWSVPEGVIVGRLWASSDGKGRTKYPMIVCALVENAPLDWACVQVLPRLAQLEADCVGTQSAELVRFTVGTCQRELEKAAAEYTAEPPPEENVGDLVRALMQSPRLAADDRQGMARILYEMDRELVPFKRSGQTSITSKTYEPPSAHIRAPRGLSGLGEGARAWIRVVEQEVLSGYPIFVLQPIGKDFVDIIVGEPRAKAFFCARASAESVGLASDVPYTMTPAETAAVMERVNAWAQGQAIARRSGGALASIPDNRKKVVLKVALAALAAAFLVVIVMALRSGKPAASEDPPAASLPDVPPKSSDLGNAAGPASNTAGNDISARSAEGDPRPAWGIESELTNVGAAVDDLEKVLRADGMDQRADLRAKVADVARRAEIVRTIPWRAGAREQIQADVTALSTELANIKAEVAAEKDAAGRRVSELIRKLESSPPVSSPALVTAWRNGLAGIDRFSGREQARLRASALADLFKAATGAMSEVGDVPAPEGALIDRVRWTEATQRRRQSLEAEVGVEAAAGRSDGVTRLVSAYGKWCQEAAQLGSGVHALEQALADGTLLNADLRPSLDERLRAVRGSAAFALLEPAILPVLEQVDAVQSLRGVTSDEALIATLKAHGTRAPVAVAAWSQLYDRGWPRIPADLAEAALLAQGPLRRTVDAVPEAGPREGLQAKVAVTSRDMWARFARASCINQAGADAALASMQALGTTPAQLTGLPDSIRYNLLLAKLQRDVVAIPDDQLRPEVGRFLASIDAMGPTILEHQAAADLVKTLRASLDPARGTKFDQIGPGVAGWSARGPDAEGTLEYTWRKPDGSEHAMSFRRVGSLSESASYLSTTEVSVGQFIDVVQAQASWNLLRPHLHSYTPPTDPRRGPRVWEWSIAPNEVMKVSGGLYTEYSKGWLRPRPTMSGQAYYAEGVEVASPSPDMPMQYVSPTAAVLFARSLGCRLPSPEEWAAADGVARLSSPAEKPNLRDRTWQRQQAAVLAAQTTTDLKVRPDFPAQNIFRPPSAAKVPDAEEAPATDDDDGILWFAPVGRGSKFHHLRGNVAELVWEDPQAMEKAPPTAEAVKGLFGKGEQLKVIGGSALSPKSPAPEERAPVSLSKAAEGFPDVGFRLAFSAPLNTGVESKEPLHKIVAAARYLSEVKP